MSKVSRVRPTVAEVTTWEDWDEDLALLDQFEAIPVRSCFNCGKLIEVTSKTFVMLDNKRQLIGIKCSDCLGPRAA